MSIFQLVSSFIGTLIIILLSVIAFFLRNLYTSFKSVEKKVALFGELFAAFNVKMIDFEKDITDIQCRLRTVERTQDKCSHCDSE